MPKLDGQRLPPPWRPGPAEHSALAHADWADAVAALPPASIHLLYADPPFNAGRARQGPAGRYSDHWADPEAYLDWLSHRLRASIPALAPSAAILLHVDQRWSHRVRVLLDDLLGPDHFVNHLIWTYGLGGSSPTRFARKHDDILYYRLDPREYYFDPPRVPATSRRMAGRDKKATDVLDIPSINNMARERTGYPTQKPLALLSLLIDACCPPNAPVLDPCCGSGTTLIAAAQSGRPALGIDTSQDAIAVTSQRLALLNNPTPTAPTSPAAPSESTPSAQRNASQ